MKVANTMPGIFVEYRDAAYRPVQQVSSTLTQHRTFVNGLVFTECTKNRRPGGQTHALGGEPHSKKNKARFPLHFLNNKTSEKGETMLS